MSQRYSIVWQGSFFFARACAYISEIVAIVFLSSTLLLAEGPAQSSPNDKDLEIQNKLETHRKLLQQTPASKDALANKLSQETEPKVRVGLLALLSATHLKAESVGTIEPYLNDADPLVRSQAVITLGALGGRQVVNDLKTVLQDDENSGVRSAAAFWLGSLKDPSAASALGQAMQDDADGNVRAQAANSLKQLATPSAKSLLKQGQNDSDVRVRKMANE